MKNNIKILHLASFIGNIGDNVNHLGFYNWFQKLIPNKEISWTELEIREFYWKNKKWDNSIVAYFNEFDLVVIGGGNYLELWVDDSPTGTSIGLSIEQLELIKTPIFFNALGFDIHQGVNSNNDSKAKKLLDYIFSKSNRMITVRNDGAIENLKTLYGSEYSQSIPMCPDGGFYIHKDNSNILTSAKNNSNELNLVINLACDMESVRFKNFPNESSELYLKEISSSLAEVVKKFDNIKLIFAIHMYSDLWSTYQVLKNLPDNVRRKQVKVCSYDKPSISVGEIIDVYKNADLVIASRFHSNVLALAMGKKTIPLVNYPQISNLYKDIRLSELSFDVSNPGFGKSLTRLIMHKVKLDKADYDYKALNKMLENSRIEIEEICSKWLQINKLI